jgi:L-serine dehydratase
MNECISVFDMLKIGVGPSSSHTLGPWRGAERFLKELREEGIFESVNRVRVDLYGSLSLTGKGHATDLAVMLGLSGADPEYVPIDDIANIIDDINLSRHIFLGGLRYIPF